MTAGAAGPGRRVVAPVGNAKQVRSHTSARPARPNKFKIDVGRHVAEIERVLRADGDLTRRAEALEILDRWQLDEMLDDASRKKARRLVLEFAAGRPNQVCRR